ncbi:MAG TPA: M81 family metallopeptidase [Thermomicrobiales bacterium]|nr:M81 family metallopeptidase [Thermomicrobiales bacterium]
MGSPRRSPRIAIGGILHETNTFSPGVTTLDDFRHRTLLRGDDLLRAARGGPGAPGGALAAAGDATILPLLLASATPGGPVTTETFESLAGDLTDRLRGHQRRWPGIDGVLLFLHGAMVTTTDDDPDGTLLLRIRELVGDRVPVMAVIDSHANISARMVDMTNGLFAYRDYPHTDTFERGMEAMRACLNLTGTTARTSTVSRRLPLLMPLLAQSTDAGSPFCPVVERAEWWRTQPGIESISLVPGFPFADVAGAGATVLVRARDQRLAGDVADDLATQWWNLRGDFSVQGMALGDWNATPGNKPTVLAEISDNPGAGGTGDGTHLLRYLIDAGYERVACGALHDPAAVDACHRAGVGAVLPLAVGGRAHSSSGQPVTGAWTVVHLGDGSYTNEGAMSHGARGSLGRTATVVLGAVSVMLSAQRTQTLDPGVFRAGGIEPERCLWLAVKSSVHYRAGFRAVAGDLIDVECPGLSPSSLQSLEYQRVIRPIAPLDTEVSLSLTLPTEGQRV